MLSIRSYVYLWLALCANLLIKVSEGFNIDTIGTSREYNGEKGSMFGYNIALHMENNRSWVICGAPKLSTEIPFGGGVFVCPSDNEASENCSRLNINLPPSVLDLNVYNVSDAWLGASLESLGKNRPIVICAPRLLYLLRNKTGIFEAVPTGSCFVIQHLRDTTVARHIDPCKKKTIGWGIEDSTCQAGFSIAVSKQKDEEYLYIGSPSHIKISYSKHIHTFSLTSYSEVKMRRKNVLLDLDETTNFQYAIVSIKFGSKGVFAASMPRGSGYNGTVFIFDMSGNVINKIVGEQLGSYFGYALCVLDINGDDKDDLVVSAPLFANVKTSELTSYDVGRIYVYIQNAPNETFLDPVPIDGFTSRGRFGLSLISLTDIDIDGYMDYAVGAPYDGPENRGAVYIYRGSAKGPMTTYSQAIYAENFIDPPKTFGFSLSGAMDVDGNGYPDLAIGAYESDKVFLFRARPIININGSINFMAKNKLVSLSSRTCMENERAVPCTDIESCFSFTGLGVPDSIDLSIFWSLDVTSKGSRRMFYLDTEKNTTKHLIMNISKEKQSCVLHTVFLDPDMTDLLSSFVVRMTYTPHNASSGKTKRSSLLLPIVNPHTDTIKQDQLSLVANCGLDGICTPDLSLNITANESHVLGSPDPLTFEVSISNYGEDAYGATFCMAFSEKLYFQKVEAIQSELNSPMCSILSHSENCMLQCNIGNLFESGKTVAFKVYLNPSYKYDAISDYILDFKVDSINNENLNTTFDNIATEKVKIVIDTRIRVIGTSLEREIYYDINECNHMHIVNKTTIGTGVIQKFVIRAIGVTPIHEVQFRVQWPVQTLAGDKLLHSIEKIEDHEVSCYAEMDIELKNIPHEKETTNILNFSREINDSFKNHLICNSFQCGTLSCTITNLSKSDEAWIVLRSQLVPCTINRLAPSIPVQMSIRIAALVSNRPYFTQHTTLDVYLDEVVYTVIPKMQKIHVVPLEVVLASALSGTFLFFLMVYPLYKCGFFKRQKIKVGDDNDDNNQNYDDNEYYDNDEN